MVSTGKFSHLPRLFILGGAGITGSLIARFLLEETQSFLVLAGRNLRKVQRSAESLNTQFDGERVEACQVDAADPENLSRAFQGMDWIVVASSTARYAENVARAALDAGAHYLDVQFSNHKYAALHRLEAEIERKGLCFITDGGFHPGLPAAMVRWAEDKFTRLDTANISSVIQIDWRGLTFSESTLDEMVEELMSARMEYFQEGSWKQASWTGISGVRYFQFDPPFGRRYCMPMLLEEMRTLPEVYPSLQETGFYVGGFNWFVDWLVFPLMVVLLKLWPQKGVRPAGRILLWGLKTFSRQPFGTLLQLQASG